MIFIENIGDPDPTDIRKEGDLTFRCVRGVERGHTPKGIAMAMPSFWGWADIQPWLTASLFEGYEIWVCDACFASGSLNEGNRMADSAVSIADAIATGQAPRPGVLFGFSAAGYLAWLVDHVLGGEQRKLVIVDAAPVHRVGYRNVHRAGEIPITRLTEIVDNGTRVANMLLVRRATSPNYTIPGTDRISWLPSDGLSTIIDVTALDHMEMNLADIYSVIRSSVRDFSDGKILPHAILLKQEMTFGGKVKSLLDSEKFDKRKEITSLTETPPHIDHRVAMGALLYLSILHSDFPTVSNFIKAVNQSIPNFRDFLYAETCLQKIENSCRKRKKHSFQRPKLGSPQAIDAALGRFSENFPMRVWRHAKFYARILRDPAFTKRRIFNALHSRIRIIMINIQSKNR